MTNHKFDKQHIISKIDNTDYFLSVPYYMVYSEHFSNHNHQEVKADLQSLIEKQCFETKSDLQNFKQEVGMHFSDEKLIHTIKTLFQNVSGQRDENLCNEKVTPAHDFLTQLILIRCGLERFTKIDSDLGEGSKK